MLLVGNRMVAINPTLVRAVELQKLGGCKIIFDGAASNLGNGMLLESYSAPARKSAIWRCPVLGRDVRRPSASPIRPTGIVLRHAKRFRICRNASATWTRIPRHRRLGWALAQQDACPLPHPYRNGIGRLHSNGPER